MVDEGEARRLAERHAEHLLKLHRQHHPPFRRRGRRHGAFRADPEADARRAGGGRHLGAERRRREGEHAHDRRRALEEPDAVGLAHGIVPLAEEHDEAHRLRRDQRDEEEGDELTGEASREELHLDASSTSAAKT